MTAEIRQGDALALLRKLPTGSVDAVITDPPYFLPATHYSVRTGSARSLSDLSILEHFFRDVFTECARVLRPTGVLYAFCDGQSYPAFYAVSYTQFRKVRPLIWDKVNSYNGWSWRHQHELILFAEMPDAPNLSTGDGDVLRERPVKIDAREHLAQKPVALMQKLVAKTKPGGLVVDPFAGSGTTGIASVIEGREFLGFELSPVYADMARSRIGQAVQGYKNDGAQLVMGVEDGAA